MRQQERKDDAVSPVIGIMLMLVVTIIIAAVVTGFATDLSKDTEKTPTAFFDADSENDKIMLKHKGGEPIRLQDIQLTIEQGGGVSTNQEIYILYGANGDLTVRGDGEESAKVVSVGDVILEEKLLAEKKINRGSVALWTLTYVPTNGLIASGEFVVL